MATPKTLTTEESDKLLNKLLGNYHEKNYHPKRIRNYTMALLMLDAGLRVGEVVQLHGYHLYFNCLPVTSIIIPPEIAKNKMERIIPVSQRLSDALKKYHTTPLAAYIKPTGTYAFYTAGTGQSLTTRQVERIIRAAAMKALGRPVHPHVLRHTFASNLMRVTNMRTVQELLGHKNLSSTQIYTHPNSEDLKKAIDSLPAIQEAGCYDSFLSSPGTDTPNRLNTPGTDRDMG